MFEGRHDRLPEVRRRGVLKVREALEGAFEVVVRGVDGVGLDGHEDGQAVQGGRDRLGRGRGVILCGNEAFYGVCKLAWSLVEGVEAVQEGVDVLVRIGRVHGEPVLKGRHVEGRDVQDVEEALVSPGIEQGAEGGKQGRGVQAHDGVGDVELVLVGDGGRAEVVEGEVAIEVGQGLRELVGLEARVDGH